MECSDREAILRLMQNNAELRRLYEEHQALQNQLASYDSRPYLTNEEEAEEKRLKVLKLHGVDKMMQILCEMRGESENYASP